MHLTKISSPLKNYSFGTFESKNVDNQSRSAVSPEISVKNCTTLFPLVVHGKNSKKDGIFFIPRLDFPAMKKLTANFSSLLVIGKP